MTTKCLLKINALLVTMLFSVSANAALIVLDESDVFGVYPGNDGDAAEFMADTGLSNITELFRDESMDDKITGISVYQGTVTKIDYLDYLVVKFDGVYGVYDVTPYAVGDDLEWHTSDFTSECAALEAPNCGAATSHVTGYGVVPVPPAVWLFASGLIGLVGIARRKS